MSFRNLLAGCALALAASNALALPPTGMPPPMMVGPGHAPVPPFLHGVTLTEEQRDRMFEIMHAQMPALRAREKELRQAHEALLRLSLNGEFDDVKAKALADAGARAMAEIALTRARTDHKIFRLLTPEQREQVEGARARGADGCGEPPRR